MKELDKRGERDREIGKYLTKNYYLFVEKVKEVSDDELDKEQAVTNI